MTPNNFRVKNGLTVSNGIVVEGGSLVVGNVTINSTSISAGTGAVIDSDSVGGNTASDLRGYTDLEAGAAYSNAATFASNADNISTGTVAIGRLPVSDAIDNATIEEVATANSVKVTYDLADSAYTLAAAANGSAANAYSNAVAYAANVYTNAISESQTYTQTYASNADNISSGTVNSARLPSANSTVAGAILVIDDITNTSITIAASANSVKAAVSKANDAYTNAAAYALAVGSTAYSNATVYADTVAGTAYSNATTYAANADHITSGTVNVQRLPTVDSVVNTSIELIPVANNVKTAYDVGIAANTRAASAQTAAASAYSNAISYIDIAIGTANSAVTGNAAAAYTNAVSYTDTKIGTANAAITGNAATAYTNAVSYTDTKIGTANSAITGNAATAYTNATTFAANATNISSGTLAEARLPYRMDQNVRTTDTVTFNTMTITGNLVVQGTTTTVNTETLSVEDNMIYLNANNTVTNPDLGFAGNYNDGVYQHAGFFRDADDGYWKTFDSYTPEPDASPYINTAHSSFTLNGIWAGDGRFGNTTVYSTINSTAFSQTANNATYLNGQLAAYYTNATNISTGTLNASRLPTLYLGTTTIQSTSAAQAVTGITTLAAGNTTITGTLSTTGEISVDRVLTANNGAGTNIEIGDDAWFGDVNVADTVRITGQQSANNGYIIFGNANNNHKLGRSGTGALTWNSDFTVSGITTHSANVAMDNNYIVNAAFKRYTEAIVTNSNATGGVTIDCSLGNFFNWTLTGNITSITFSNVPSGVMYSITIAAKQDAGGTNTITWPASVKWPGGVTPPASTGGDDLDIWSLMTYDGGTTWIGSLTVKDAA